LTLTTQCVSLNYMINTTWIVNLILALAPLYNIDPKVALSVAIVESGLKPDVMGEAGETGLFQIMPDVAKKKGFTTKQLKIPIVNIAVGLEMLEEAKKTCSHKRGLTYLVCYNYGRRNALKVHHPEKWPYVLKVQKELKKQQSIINWVK